VDSPFAPTRFVVTAVQVAGACATLVEVNNLPFWLVPLIQTSVRFEPDNITLLSG